MGDTPTENRNSFERHYGRFKDNGLPLAESERALSDRVITQHLQRNFNNQSIPMNRIDFSVPGAISRIESVLIKTNEGNWNPDYSDGVISDGVDYISDMIYGEESKTPEQLASDQNAKAYLNKSRDDTNVVNDIISRTPDLTGFTLDDAKIIARADISDTDNGNAITSKFPDADPNMMKAVAYTMLHVNKDQITDSDLQGQDFAEMARGYMHYAHEGSKTYNNWELDRRNEVIESITSNPEIMADLALIKAPHNINTDQDLQEQFAIRERIADGIAGAFAQSYGIANTLDGDDVTVAYATRAAISKDSMGGFMSHKSIGILNDETIVLRYNPAQPLMDNTKYLAATDGDEATLFLKAAIEEVQHGVDQIYADKLVLGTLPEGAPVDHHATMSALSFLTYAEGHVDFDTYSSQYVESTAKIVADDIAFEIAYKLENPSENTAPAVIPEDDNTITPADTIQPIKI